MNTKPSPLHRSWKLADQLREVKYRGGDPRALLADCEEWLGGYEAADSALRERFAGSRMLVSQLDLLSVARDRVQAIASNCRSMLAAA